MDSTVDAEEEEGSSFRPVPRTHVCDICGFVGKRPLDSGPHPHTGSAKCLGNLRKKSVAMRTPIVSTTVSSSEPILCDILKLLKSQRCIMKRIPKAARITVASSLSAALDKCVQDNSYSAWTKLFLFPYVILSLPGKSKKERRSSLTSIVKRNVSLFETHFDASTLVHSPHSLNCTHDNSSLVRRVVSKINGGDVSGAVRLLCSDESLAENNAETLQILREKHPPAPLDLHFPDIPSSLSPEVDASELLKMVRSFPNDSAGGIDGLRPQHLKDLLAQATSEVPTPLLNSLVVFETFVLRGEVLPEICSLFYGATLIALRKKGGGMRPIAIGGTLRRLSGKIVVNRVKKDIASQLQPLQIGFGVEGGCEGAIHAARIFLDTPADEAQFFLKLDFNNAFNRVRRDKMMDAVVEHLPAYFKYFRQVYGSASMLIYGENIIMSETGIQQGDPLGPLVFSLLTLPVARRLKSRLKVLYLDDAVVAGSLTEVLGDFEVLMNCTRETGLSLNYSKCELYAFSGNSKTRDCGIASIRSLAPEIIILNNENLCLLGSPLTQAAVPLELNEKKKLVERMSSRLHLLSRHHSLYLLKNCLSAPKLMHLLRTSVSWKYLPLLKDIDEILKTSLQSIVNIAFSDISWEQSSLPTKWGGFGVRCTEELALPAFIASVRSVQGLISSILPGFTDATAESAVGLWTQTTQSQVPQIEFQHLQRHWDGPLVKLHVDNILHCFRNSSHGLATFKAACQKESSAWLAALPSVSLGNFLDDDVIRISCGLRLGVPVCVPHKCKNCRSDVDEFGTHGLDCNGSEGRFATHGSLNDVIHRALNTAQFSAILKPRGLIRESNERPDGRTRIPWKNGKFLAWDATCVNTVANSYVDDSAINPGSAARKAELRKKRTYKDLGPSYLFYPVAFETLGTLGVEAKTLIFEISKLLMEKTGEKRSKQFLIQQCSMHIQRGNAVSVQGTLPSGRSLDEIYYALKPDVVF